MNLFLLRHGIAVNRDDLDFQNDAARPLVPKGKQQLRQSCAALRRMKLHFDLILSSPLARARQTAEIVAQELKFKKQLVVSNALRPGGDAKILITKLNRLKPAPENILLVGHEPDLSELISLLVTGGQELRVVFKKGGLCKLDVANLQAGKCGTLAWLLSPKQMKAMA